jgi:hypothetical protein
MFTSGFETSSYGSGFTKKFWVLTDPDPQHITFCNLNEFFSLKLPANILNHLDEFHGGLFGPLTLLGDDQPSFLYSQQSGAANLACLSNRDIQLEAVLHRCSPMSLSLRQ